MRFSKLALLALPLALFACAAEAPRSDEGAAASAVTAPTPAPAPQPDSVIQIVLDSSGAMNDAAWTAARDGIKELLGTARNQGFYEGIWVGVTVFSGNGVHVITPAPIVGAGSDVQIAGILGLIDRPQASGGATNTLQGLAASYDVVRPYAHALQGVVLLSDAAPTAPGEADACIAAVTAAEDDDRIRTNTFGFLPHGSTGAVDTFLNALAEAGGQYDFAGDAYYFGIDPATPTAAHEVGSNIASVLAAS